MADYQRDWENLGRTIEDIIDRAVNSQDYQQLNQTISQVVDKAVDFGNGTVRKVREQNYYRKRGKVVYTYTPPQQKQDLPALYKNTNGKTVRAILKAVGGGLLTGIMGMSLLMHTTLSLFFNGGYLSTGFAVVGGLLIGGLTGGIILLSNGIGNLNRLSRFKMYCRTLGQKTHCSLAQLAASVGKTPKFVQKDLAKMIGEGLFLEGHLDAEGKNLITSHETYQHYQQTQRQMLAQQRAQAEAQPQPQSVSPQVQEVLDKGDAFIREIRRCNDAIPGQEMSDKISRMETIVQRIFERAEAHPEIVPDLKKMMDYYLPMTVKLLNAYADMDRQPVQGQTIQNSKREIEQTLDTLNTAFEKLLDSVFRDTAMDVSSDISVLQTLLAQEGLTDDGLMK